MHLFVGDYDRRTALHLAASNGHRKAAEYLIVQAELRLGERERVHFLDARDRFNGTPLDDAVREGHHECVKLLQSKRPHEGELALLAMWALHDKRVKSMR